MAKILVSEVLKKVPNLAHNHFLEVVFLLCGCDHVWQTMRRRDADSGGSQPSQLHLTGCSSVLASKLRGSSTAARDRRFAVYKVRLPPPSLLEGQRHPVPSPPERSTAQPVQAIACVTTETRHLDIAFVTTETRHLDIAFVTTGTRHLDIAYRRSAAQPPRSIACALQWITRSTRLLSSVSQLCELQ